MNSDQYLDRRWLVRNYNGNKVLFVTDLHLGFDVEWFGRGLWTTKPSWSIEIIKNLRDDILKVVPSHLVICGDLEHHYRIRKIKDKDPQISLSNEIREAILQAFRREILEIPGLEVIIIQGENDVTLLQELTDSCHIIPSEGKPLFNNQLGIVHGHISPFKEIVFSSEIILGHLHPEIELVDDLQIKHRYPTYLKLHIAREDLFSLFQFPFEFEEIGMVDLVPITILPTYNHFLSGYVINIAGGGKRRHKQYPLLRPILHHPDLQVQMTDGIELGRLIDL